MVPSRPWKLVLSKVTTISFVVEWVGLPRFNWTLPTLSTVSFFEYMEYSVNTVGVVGQLATVIVSAVLDTITCGGSPNPGPDITSINEPAISPIGHVGRFVPLRLLSVRLVAVQLDANPLPPRGASQTIPILPFFSTSAPRQTCNKLANALAPSSSVTVRLSVSGPIDKARVVDIGFCDLA